MDCPVCRGTRLLFAGVLKDACPLCGDEPACPWQSRCAGSEACGAPRISETALGSARTELARRLPGLLFAAIDRWPLAGGLDAALETCATPRYFVVAIRNVPAAERLDAVAAAELAAICGSKEAPSRQLVLDLEGSQLVVQWHESSAFKNFVLKGTPSCVEALANPGVVLHESEEWSDLKSALVADNDGLKFLLCSHGYLKVCMNTAQGLLQKAGGAGRSKSKAANVAGGNAAQGAVTLGLARVLADILVRAGQGCGAPQYAEEAQQLEARREAAVEVWRELYSRIAARLGGADEKSIHLSKEMERWCGELRDTAFQAWLAELKRDPPSPCPLEAWLARRTQAGYACPAPAQPRAGGGMDTETRKMLEGVLPQGAEVALMQQTGSFMYDLHVASSDKDFRVYFLAGPEQLLGLHPPRSDIQHHVNRGFAADKRDDVEYHLQELGLWVADVAKGNPNCVELLFSGKDAVESPVWQELRRACGCFLTMRCAKQYLGFATECVKKLERKLREPDLVSGCKAAEFSKLLYHAYHKLLELRRILRGEAPSVALVGEEREKVLGCRHWRLTSVDDARQRYEELASERRALCDELNRAEAEDRLPAEVDAEALLAWLHGVRARSCEAGLGSLCAQAV